jgi:DNA-binding transcriptional LysR family regulator
MLQPLIDEPMRIVLPSYHRQAGSGAQSLATLTQETFILFPRAIGPGLYDSIIASCQRVGFSPTLGQEAPQISSIVHLVAAGFGVSVVPKSIEQIRADGIVYLPIEGEAPRAPISLAIRKDSRSATARNFLMLARQQAGAGS